MHECASNKTILAEYDKHVFGHTKAKKAIINLVNRSIMRHYQKFVYLNENYHILTPHIILLIGDTGHGKTHLVETMLTKLVHRPFIRVDATDIAPCSASEGLSVEGIKKKIRANAETIVKTNSSMYHSVEGAIDQTVVFIDEIDKQGKPSDRTGRWHERVQQALLTLLDGNDPEFAGVSYIFAGAFTEINKQIIDSKKHVLGFTSTNCKESVNDTIDWSKELIRYGIVPELAGRIKGVYKLDKLTKEQYRTILDDILLPAKKEELGLYNISVSLTEEQKASLVDKAVSSGQGVRAMKRELADIFMDLEFNYEEPIDIDAKLSEAISKRGV